MDIVRNIRLSELQANPEQPREDFDEEKLAELAESIQRNGLIQPVVVRKADGKFQVVAGERRCRAAKIAGLSQVPCLVINADDEAAARLALIENIQREDLNPLEEAQAYARLLKMEGCTQEQLAKTIGRKQSTIANKLRLLDLGGEAREALAEGKITERQARALLSVPKEKEDEVYRRVREMGLDSAGTERYVQALKKERPKKRPASRDKIFLKDARIALNTIRAAVQSIRKTNLKIEEEVEEGEDAYTVVIRIRKL